MQRILDELRRLGKKGGVWKCLENILEFGAQALAHYLRDHSITINDMMVKDKVSGTTFVVSALPQKCIFQETSVYPIETIQGGGASGIRGTMQSEGKISIIPHLQNSTARFTN